MIRPFALVVGLLACAVALGQSVEDVKSFPLRDRARKLIDGGAKYLLAAQDKEGGWATDMGPGVTAICVRALALAPAAGPKNSAVQRGAEYVLKSQRDSGGIHSAEGRLANYETSVALSMLGALKNDQYKDKIAAAQKYLKQGQFDRDDGKSVDDPEYGGVGYGRALLDRPDLSNTQIMLDALHDSGLPPDDPAYKKALYFISRCQMLGEKNDQPFAKGSSQGGFIYTAAGGGDSKAGTIEIDGRKELRCYGSMTYAGFKSMVYAGLAKDDPRVKAAREWIGANWTLSHNPNMPEKQSKQGLYYYYHTFARALAAWGEPQIKDKLGREHDWKAELIDALAALQKDDGSWINDADRWYEGKPALTTAYAMLALEAAFPE